MLGAGAYFASNNSLKRASVANEAQREPQSAASTTVVSATLSESANANTETPQGWNTYTNTEYGFSLKYPMQFHTKDFPDRIVTLDNGPNQKETNYLSVSKEEDAILGRSIAEVQKNLTANLPKISSEEKTIGGFNGLLVYNPYGGIAGETEFYFFTSKGLLVAAGTADNILNTLQNVVEQGPTL